MPQGGALVNGTYVLSAYETFGDSGGDGGKTATGVIRTESIVIKDGIASFMGASGSSQQGLGPTTGQVFWVATAREPYLDLTAKCQATSTSYMFTALGDVLQLFVLSPDGGRTSEVRTYERQ